MTRDLEHSPTPEITLMIQASVSGDLAQVRESLQAYLDRQSSPKLYIFDMVLNEAIRFKRVEIVSYLLSVGVPLEKIHYYRATEAKSAAVYEAFLEHGWDINEPLDFYEPPALGFVVDDFDLTKWFLNHNADPNCGCYLDYTPMSCAVKAASIENIQLLFDNGGNIEKGQLIHHAAEREFDDAIQVLELLLQKGARMNERMYENHWPSWNIRSFTGLGTPLHGAARTGKLMVVDYLLKKGADPTINDSKGCTALDYAMKSGYEEITALLRSS